MIPFSLGLAGRRFLAAALLIVVAFVVAWRHENASGRSLPVQVAPITPDTPRARPPVADKRLVVDVVGAVRQPGLVRLPAGSRAADAVAAAGGLTKNADRSGINFAAPVADGEQVAVPVRGAAGAAAVGAGVTTSGPVSLSSATAEQLDTLPGIGPVTAQKIVSYRQQHGAFHSVAELDAIPGIGAARLAELQGLVVP